MKLFFLSLIFTISAMAVLPQSVVITPKKTVYTRPKPIQEFKKTFTVIYPKVKASTPALSKKIERTISYERVLEVNIQEEIKDVQWLYEADYEVGFNARGFLSITLSADGSGAYPSVFSRTVVVNLKNGDRVIPADVFTDLNDLVSVIKKKLQAEIEARVKELKADPESKDVDPSELFAETDFTMEDLEEFSINETGVTFIYDYGFPHVIKALEPDGRFKFSWSEIKKFVKPKGPFEKFLRK